MSNASSHEGAASDQAVVYAGPWKRVEDDDGHSFERGVRSAVCAARYAPRHSTY
jgi:hypothetical protein